MYVIFVKIKKRKKIEKKEQSVIVLLKILFPDKAKRTKIQIRDLNFCQESMRKTRYYIYIYVMYIK